MVGINSYGYLHQFLSKSSSYKSSISDINYQIQNKSKAIDLADIGSTKIDPYIGSRMMTEKSEYYVNNIQSALTRLELYENTFNEFDSLISDMLETTPAGLNEAENMNLKTIGFSNLSHVENILNTKETADSYLFHGKDGRRSWEAIEFKSITEEYNDETYGNNKLLDEISGAKLAYSTRQLTDSYTGASIQVRRADTDAVLDVGFYDNGNFDYLAITEWLDGADTELYVSKWYDQSGSGNNLEVTDVSAQPRLELRTEYDYTFSKGPALIFDGVNGKMITETVLNAGGYSDILGDSDRTVLVNMSAGKVYDQVMGYGDMYQEHGVLDVNVGYTGSTYTGDWDVRYHIGDAGIQTGFNGSVNSEVGASTINNNSGRVYVNDWDLYAMRYGGGVVSESANYDAESNTAINGGLNTAASNLEVGEGIMDRDTQPANDFFIGDMTELVILPNDLTESEAGTIESNIKDYNWSNNSSKVLDLLPASTPNAKMAYGLRQLDSSYAGPAVQLRYYNPTPTGYINGNTSLPIYDPMNALPPQDFGFDASGNLDIAAIEAWSVGREQYVSINKWYDQSGNVPSNNLISSSNPTVRPPKLVIDGGTSARISFNGQTLLGENQLDNANYSDILGGSDRTVFTKMRATQSNRQVLGFGSNNAAYGTFDVSIGDNGDMGIQTGYVGAGSTIGETSIQDGNNQITLNDWETYTARYDGNTVYESIDGGAETATALPNTNTMPDASGTPDTSSYIVVGDGRVSQSTPAVDYYEGRLTEIVIFDNRLNDTDMDAAKNNIIEYKMPWGDYGSGTPFPDEVIDPEVLPDNESGNSNNKKNLSPYNTYYEHGTHAGRYYNTERDHEMQISDTHKIDVNWSPYEGFIQNMVYGIEIIAKAVQNDPSNVDPSNPGVSYEESIAAGKALLETAREQLKSEIAELSTKKSRLIDRKEAHESDISFYKNLLDNFDKPEDDAELALKLENIYNSIERSYTITSSLSKSNLMNFLFS